MANGSQPGMGSGGSSYMQLMQSLMNNPSAFTGGGFGQTLAANPQMSPQAQQLAGNWQPGMTAQQMPAAQQFAWGQQYGAPQQQWPSAYAGSPIGQAMMGMSPQASALASWQPAAPVMPAVANPIPAFVAQQQAAQQQAAAVAAQAPPPVDNNPSGSGSE